MSYTVIACRRWPGEDYLGNRVIQTDEMVGDMGWRWLEGRALAFAERHAPGLPTYHLRVERIPGILPRYSIKAFQNRAEPRDPGMPTN